MDKRGTVQFGTIVAIIGSILIGCGVAWLIADNWHQMPAPVKVLLLVALTGGSFYAGVALREKQYPGTAHALFALGALLYTLSVFLIAQIYATDASVQGFAWLLLLSFAGVIATAYIFDASANLAIGLLEFLLWLPLQYFALRSEFSAGPLVLSLLCVAVLFYGLHLLHQSRGHGFSRVYRFFTAFYLLAFAYVLSFQLLLPLLWTGTTLTAAGVSFLLVCAIIAVGVLITAIIKQPLPKNEALGAGALLLLLLLVIGASYAVRDTTGTCYQKSCYDFDSRDACSAAPANLNCEWLQNDWSNGCTMRNCGNIRDAAACEASDLNCKWANSYCGQQSCWQYNANRTTCEGAPAKMNCSWVDNGNGVGYCEQPASPSAYDPSRANRCEQHTNKHDACVQDAACRWSPGFSYWGNHRMPPSVIVVWVLANVALLAAILAVIFYGTWRQLPHLVNLGIFAFALMVLTRYIGFVIDLRAYLSMSLLFISGGLLLILGGWGIERWRRKLMQQARHTDEPTSGSQQPPGPASPPGTPPATPPANAVANAPASAPQSAAPAGAQSGPQPRAGADLGAKR